MTDALAPALSVIVPSVSGWGDLKAALEALAAQRGAAVESVVVDRVGATVREPLRREFPRARPVEAPPGTPIPALRRMGFAAARAPIVGVIEGHVLTPPDRAERMLAAHAAGAMVGGGSVVNAATTGLVDRSAFLCEYAPCLAPPAGPSRWLPGNNVTYRRTLLDRFAATVAADRWEHHLHDALREAGIALESRPEIVVLHNQHTSVARYARQRFLYSRVYAAQRAGALRRFAWGVGARALPPLLLGRITGAVWRSRPLRRVLLLSLRLMGLCVLVWAAGESAGAWFGPGDAPAQVA